MNDQTSNPLDAISKALKELSDIKGTQDAVFSDLRFLEFKSKKENDNFGKGMIFTGEGNAKQIVLANKPDRFFVSENLDLAREKHLSINGAVVLNSKELGTGVTKSSLKELGRLRGLIVDGSVSINQYLYYNSAVDRLGLGTETPNGAFSVAEMGVEVMLGTSEEMHGMVGTFATNDFDIVTDNTARITVKGNGDIVLGNSNRNPISVKVNGRMSIGVNNPDPSVDLHLSGPIRIQNRLHMYSSEPPSSGTFAVGDIVYNEKPQVGGHIGWVCLRAGSPGAWYPFGEIKERK